MKETQINPIVKEQLEKCPAADFSKFDYETGTLVIPKKTDIRLVSGSVYIIKIDKAVMAPSMFHTNWNKGMPPVSEYMLADVTSVMSQSVRCNCLDYDPTTESTGTRVWNGWLPVTGITVIKKL